VEPTLPVFVFDGDCGFCRRWATWLQRRLPPGTPIVAFQALEDLPAYGLDPADVGAASWWVASDATVHRGARSFAHALRTSPGPWRLVGRTLAAPGVRSIADQAYKLVARNRQRLPAPR
jgi:predicted DCC family thiol-disulfide oxidoreductase YuxK